MAQLLSPLTVREVRFHNRVFVSSMCQYSSEDGLPTDRHAEVFRRITGFISGSPS